jgi:hypothetical protein
MKVDKEFKKKYLLMKRKIHEGVTDQEIYRFPNGYGASVIRGKHTTYGGSEGLYELAVVIYDDGPQKEWSTDIDFSICYDTSLTDDVIGYLTRKQVNSYLKEIFELPEEEEK